MQRGWSAACHLSSYNPPSASPTSFSLLCWSCTFLLSLIQTILCLILFCFCCKLPEGQASTILPPFPVWAHPSLCWPTLRFLSSVQCVILALVALFFGMADSSHAEMWALLPSPSVHRELAAGASIWKRPIWEGGEICQIAQYFTAEPGTKSKCPAVMNRASPSSPGGSLAWDKSLHSQALSNWSTRGKQVKNVTGGKDHHRSFSEKRRQQQAR